jgi:hypothetical protein
VTPARQAIAAATADDMALSTDEIAGEEVLDVGADFNDFADEFVADGHGNGNRFARPGVPFINVDVGAADAGAINFDEDVVEADFGGGNVFQPEAGFSLALNQCFHF